MTNYVVNLLLERKKMQEALGCHGCLYCDETQYQRHNPCCTRSRAPDVAEDGTCLSRKQREKRQRRS
jgi:hypothetical protein